MAGLGAVQEKNNMYLSVAGGFIWDRKADESNPNYATQEYSRADGTTGTRQGARYADLTGRVIGVEFRTHDKYGESVNVTVDAEGERFILSISTNNQYSQCFMKALLVMDLEKDLFIKPYDFVGTDKKRAQGISFRQDGEKLNLRIETPKEFQKEKDFWKSASKKQIKRFFEDLSDWFVGEVEEKVVPKLAALTPQTEPKSEAPKAESKPKAKPAEEEITSEQIAAESLPSPIKMKKAIKAYIAENYEGEEMPSLSKAEVVTWYKLVLAEDELPFPEDNVVEGSALDEELNALLPNS